MITHQNSEPFELCLNKKITLFLDFSDSEFFVVQFFLPRQQLLGMLASLAQLFLSLSQIPKLNQKLMIIELCNISEIGKILIKIAAFFCHRQSQIAKLQAIADWKEYAQTPATRLN
ncbi:hypothetical protein BpHYR1_018256 [Brachionus plicatilis]|uniref:Uncharacterized protein n=1 Tax=Brachionus plicatilis TaxID=10195 RepID=A0A3M7RVU3_BRAPC|nr:hypothetical protein BpHYR1_018256 [Brachionus plicatilis]